MYKLRWDVVVDDDDEPNCKTKKQKSLLQHIQVKKTRTYNNFLLIVINRLTNIHGLGQ